MRKTEDGPAWARGYDVGELKAITSMVGEHDAGMVHGAFGRYSERELADDLEAGRAKVGPRGDWFLSARRVPRAQAVKDFTGGVRLRLEPGTALVSRLAWSGPQGARACYAALRRAAGRRTLAVQVWQEHPGERELVAGLGLELAAVKIAASSEMRGVYIASGMAPPAYPQEQAVGLAVLSVRLPVLGPLIDAVSRLGEYAQHYSSYNAGGSWTALSLRGFYDEPERIEKPAEMSKRWQAEHPGELSNEVRDTPLRAQLPEVEPVLAALPGAGLLPKLPGHGLERVRLMALAPGGGELTRHADITDRAAGAEPGRVVRLHVPLVTNELVSFSGWDLDGCRRAGTMATGHVYYLDTRKPHTAFNGGDSPRIHLVADVIANDATVQALRYGREFQPA